MVTKEIIKKIIKDYKSEEYIDFLYQNIDLTINEKELYKCSIKPFLEKYYNISLSGGPNKGQARYWIVRGYSEVEANELKKEVSMSYVSNTVESIMRKRNVTKEEAIIIAKEIYDKGKNTLNEKYTKEELINIQEKKKRNLKNIIAQYGEEEGTKRYKDMCKKRTGANTLDAYIRRYGEEEGTKRYNTYRDTMDKKVYNIKKYNYEKYIETCNKKAYSSTLKFYIEKYGETDGILKFNDRQDKWQSSLNNTMISSRTPNNRFRASKESLNVLIPIYKFARKNGINKRDIYIGAGGLSEYIRYYNGSVVAYDFVIESLKLVVEYDGAAFHPKLINEENWIHPYCKDGPEQYFIKDQKKKEYIINKGFTYFNIRSDDSDEIKIKKIHEIFEYIKNFMI